MADIEIGDGVDHCGTERGQAHGVVSVGVCQQRASQVSCQPPDLRIEGCVVDAEAGCGVPEGGVAGGCREPGQPITGARFLALNPGHRQQLIDDPALVPNAVEELIRRHGLVNTARLITQDTEFQGMRLKEEEQILVPNHLYGLDERQVDNPLVVDFTRPHPEQHHAAFGNGPHRRPGSFLAKLELTVFLQEWLPRIPDFVIKPGTTPRTASGSVNTVHELHLAWDTDPR